jgi:REP element-mobilizing transposase RayT
LGRTGECTNSENLRENINLSNYERNSQSVGYSEYHLQWVTKYRFQPLGKESHFVDCENAVRSVVERHGIKIQEIGVMPDHVHVIVIIAF